MEIRNWKFETRNWKRETAQSVLELEQPSISNLKVAACSRLDKM